MPSKPKPRRQSQVLAGGTEICSSSGVRSRRGGKKVAKSSGVVGGGCVCRKVALVSRCSRCGPTLLVRLPTGLVLWTGLRSAGCERWMPTGCNKYAPQKTAGLPGTELRKRAVRHQ